MRISSDTLQRLLNLGVLVYDAASETCKISSHTDSLGWELSLGFENIAIKQKKNRCNSRLDVDTTAEIIKGVWRPIPMIASNMSTVCNAQFCIQLYRQGALGVMHRAAYDEVLVKEVEKIAEACDLVAASVGVGESQLKLAAKLIEAGSNIIFIDIAHGYSDAVLNIGKEIKSRFPDVKVVIGNTTNVGLLQEAATFADAIKVGIAQGAACETKNTAGCTEKQFSAVLKFKEVAKQYKVPIISDGGTREPADMVKAIGAGANSIMAGSIFARCPESAAETIQINDKTCKIYAGMASRYVQERWKGGLKDGTCPEGGVRYLEQGESLDKLLERWRGALMSGITYAGGWDIPSFQTNVEFVRLA